MVEDVNCYSAGVICRKSISINVGSSLIIFDDDSGDPVRTCTGAKQSRCQGRQGFLVGKERQTGLETAAAEAFCNLPPSSTEMMAEGS